MTNVKNETISSSTAKGMNEAMNEAANEMAESLIEQLATDSQTMDALLGCLGHYVAVVRLGADIDQPTDLNKAFTAMLTDMAHHYAREAAGSRELVKMRKLAGRQA